MQIEKTLAVSIRLILASSLATATLAAQAQDSTQNRVLETVRVSASAVDEDPTDLAASYGILQGQSLFERSQSTLGDTLNSLPGVNSDTFGGGASRPVIRGQTAPRVAVLSDSAVLLDASDISPDHAVTAEPLLIERIEVLRGPATLLYGSGAIGGVVNVLDKKIPDSLPDDRLDGSLGLRGSSVAKEKAGAFEITAQATDHLVLHAEAMMREADDYRARGLDESRVHGTFSESENASLGMSWVGDRGFIGLAYSYRDDGYGIPGHSHEYEGCHPHGSALHCGSHDAGGEDDHDHDHEHEHEAVPEISLLSKRVDLRGELTEPFAGIERIRLRASHTDYRHYELEQREIATTFLNEGYEARVELQHREIGAVRGVVGVQYTDTDFSALGAEAFMPEVQSRSIGLFAVEHVELSERWHLELGGRQEWQKHSPINDTRGRPEFDDSATSLSAAAIWEFVPDYSFTLALTRSERLPHAQELYARGIHLATNTYECGLVPHPLTCGGAENNAELQTETSNNIELTLKKNVGDMTFAVGVFRNDIDDYIYARTLDQFEDFRLIKYTQDDAEFTGLEAEATYRVSESLSATVFGDYVRAELKDGGNLPRIPAARYGTRLNAKLLAIAGELEYYRVNEQDDIADLEAVTPGYDMLNLTLSFDVLGENGPVMYVRGTNLLDEVVWNHASYLARVVPLPGRGVTAGLRVSF
ncbi:TonB-dependent receptor domain-containing protein [Peristeroidobacter agariperforans]|uniref:TonB-dependent receptor domain-containing protein n=1 Tax=Peristeroidobacter agariperforans TaxID=268404 RepID=UPI00101C434A|nr:TonB-dependent receptor [Peristeroidobacter agariperforans]